MRPGTGIPVLEVQDVATAVAYYRRFFGFEEMSAPTGSAALVGGHGVAIRLRAAGGQHDRADPPDAVLLVDRPRRLHRLLDDLGAHLLPGAELGPAWAGFFAFRDCYRNVVAVGPAGGAVPAVKGWAAEPLDAVRLLRNEWRGRRERAAYTREFRDFYEGLAVKHDIYYLAFTGGLLHWVAKALSYVPAHVNLVLVGSDLAADELACAARLGRPFHHVGPRLDDSAAWELLFAVNRENFGWIDVGCLVLDGRIFGELARIDAGTSVNCAWSWDSGRGFPIASTHLLFVNVAAARERGVGACPGAYSHRRVNRQVEGRRCYTRRPSRAQLRLLRRMLPADEAGRPIAPGGMPVFAPMMMYQLLARARGFQVARVRELAALGHVRGRDVEDESSDELLYIGALRYADVLEEFSGYFHDPGVRTLYLIAEHVALAGTAADLPVWYRRRLERVEAELARQGLPARAVPEAARGHLMAERGMSAAAAEAVLRAGAAAPR